MRAGRFTGVAILVYIASGLSAAFANKWRVQVNRTSNSSVNMGDLVYGDGFKVSGMVGDASHVLSVSKLKIT